MLYDASDGATDLLTILSWLNRQYIVYQLMRDPFLKSFQITTPSKSFKAEKLRRLIFRGALSLDILHCDGSQIVPSLLLTILEQSGLCFILLEDSRTPIAHRSLQWLYIGVGHCMSRDRR